MNKTLLILVGVAAVLAIGYAYTTANAVTPESVGAKGVKSKGAFNGGRVRIGSKSGISANVKIPGAMGQFLSGIFHPTNQDSNTNTATSQATSASTTSQATSA